MMADEGADRLVAELGECVHLRGSPGYVESLRRVFFPAASRRRPPCVVHPRSVADVAAALRIAQETGARVTVRGGGLSSNCVADDAVMLDLSVHLGDASIVGAHVRAGGARANGSRHSGRHRRAGRLRVGHPRRRRLSDAQLSQDSVGAEADIWCAVPRRASARSRQRC